MSLCHHLSSDQDINLLIFQVSQNINKIVFSLGGVMVHAHYSGIGEHGFYVSSTFSVPKPKCMILEEPQVGQLEKEAMEYPQK
jgi:hypothetical protein